MLEALGANINLTPEQVAQCIAETGIGFMFAPNHHAAMKHAAPVRRELGVRTIFNILGPLTNPANAPQQVMGVFHADLVGIQKRIIQHARTLNKVVITATQMMESMVASPMPTRAEVSDVSTAVMAGTVCWVIVAP